ncbi:MAG: molybdenum ABC transporter ATP-binding protein [Bdellovibrionales bacterium]|nr:molybdenum ABC transporter ATP-binding protein [Massilia sp.]
MSCAPPIRLALAVRRPGFSMDVELCLPGRGVTALFGESGSGKTTILRAIAGLERHAGACLEVNGERWQDARRFVAPHLRAVGYVFQEASLFPHLTVRGNLEFARRRAPAAGGERTLAHALALLGIGHLLERRPLGLSGGERQRVAIARALLTQPQLLLMDEPLASLDGKRKEEVLPYLERIHAELAIPMLYVSHSAAEVARLADHVVVLDAGRVLASGPVAAMLARLDLSMAIDDAAGVVIDGVVGAVDAHYSLLRLHAAGGALYVAHPALPIGARLQLRILARDVSLAMSPPTDSSILNQVSAKVVSAAPADNAAHVIVTLDAGGTPLLARVTRRSYDQLGLEPGTPLWAQVKTVALLALGR